MKWLHVKTQREYVITGIGLRESDLTPEFEYRQLQDKQPIGPTFHRPVMEFLDGRFTQRADDIDEVKDSVDQLVDKTMTVKVGVVIGAPIEIGDWVRPVSREWAAWDEVCGTNQWGALILRGHPGYFDPKDMEKRI